MRQLVTLPSLKRITCPVIFLSPSNDFHGRINDLESSLNEIQSKDWRISTSPHHNHQDTAEYEVATQIWFDHHLKGNFQTPATPETELVLMQNCLPEVIIKPDSSQEIVAVEVYFTQQGILQKRGMGGDDSLNTKHRFGNLYSLLKILSKRYGKLNYLFSKQTVLFGFLPMCITNCIPRLPVQVIIMVPTKRTGSIYLLFLR